MTKRVRFVALMSYLCVLIVVPLLRRNEDPFIKYHFKQGVVLILLGILIPYVLQIPLLGWILGALLFAAVVLFWGVGVTNAITGKMNPLPIVGKPIEKVLF